MMDQSATSPELTGGVGFTFEDRCSALYLAALLAETTEAGLPSQVVARVELQRGAFGAPMDDIIVTGRSLDGSSQTLSLQVKRELTISPAASNTDFRAIVAKALATLRSNSFRTDRDRIGAVTGTIAAQPARALETVCEWARSSHDLDSFQSRFAEGVASDMHRRVRDAVQAALHAADSTATAADFYLLMRHFVLVTVNLLHEGSTTEAHAVAVLSRCLAPAESARAHELWQSLTGLAREGAGRAAQYDRTKLLGLVRGRFRFAASPSLYDDLARLAEEARAALAEIGDAVDGVHSPRATVVAEIACALAEAKFVQITGLPGTGKSALLRELAVPRAEGGAVLFLKTDRLHGSSWLSHSAALGLTGSDLKATLVEIAASGTPIVFVDGLDRVEVPNRGVVNDVLNLLATDADLADWRVLATARDNGLEPLRTWLSPRWLEAGAASVEVKPFSDGEAAVIADALPHLRRLLFGNPRLRELTRRPFFIAVLARLSPATSVATEVDLVDAWWKGGGYNASPDQVDYRQRTLMMLAREGARTLGRRVSIRECDPTAITELRRDGVIRDLRPGHTIGFAHDIYFEWAFLHLLIDREREWTTELRGTGEPPVLGRVVELLAQLAYRDKDAWVEDLTALEHSALRSQWTRAWLLGPFASSNIEDDPEQMSAAVFGNGAARLSKLVVWFQAEKTKPNPRILQRAELKSAVATLRVADAFAWPSDVTAWNRLIRWLLADPARLPQAVASDIVSVFEVWQNLAADEPNSRSVTILTLASNWLQDLEDRLHAEDFRSDYNAWGRGSERLGELEERLRALILRAGRAYPEWVLAYVERLRSRQCLRRDAFEQVLTYALILAEIAPGVLVDYTLDETLGKLPEVIASEPIDIGGIAIPRLNYHDWHTLAIKRDGNAFNQSSPVEQPFAALFALAPTEALRLIRRLANHAITAWRQLHALQVDGARRPIPLTLDFPWGQQTFWGDQRVYQWYRAVNGPAPIECGLMALEFWALSEIEGGRDLDSVLKDVVEGQDCCAVLGVAVSLVLKAQCPTPASTAIATSACLWNWDLLRWQQDRYPLNLMAFSLRGKGGAAFEAIRQGNALSLRRRTLRDVAPIYVFAPDDKIRADVVNRIQRFPENPPLDFEEELENGEVLAHAQRTAEIWAKIGDPATYHAETAPGGDGVLIQHESPHAADDDVIAAQRDMEELNERAGLQLWADACFEHGRIAGSLTLETAIERARRLDTTNLFTDVGADDFPGEMTRSAVAGVAAAALRFGELTEVDAGWSRDVVLRAARTPKAPHAIFIPSAIVLGHPCIFAANGLRAIVASRHADRDTRGWLLTLATHPLEQVSANALGEAMACWNVDPNFAWTALDLGLRLSVGRWAERVSAYGYDQTFNRKLVQDALRTALRRLRARRPDMSLAALPAAWAKVTGGPPGSGRQPPREARWRDPDEFLRWDFLPKVLRRIPITNILADQQRRPAFLRLCDHLVNWTLQKLVPPWRDERTRERRQSAAGELYEWRRELFAFLARVALTLGADEAKSRFLDRVFALEDEIAMPLVEPFVSRIVSAGVLDPRIIPASAIPLLELCQARVLAAHDWNAVSWQDGHLYGHHLPSLVQDLLFVSIVDAADASRFANGDWTDIAVVLPLVERFVGAVGHVPQVASAFFTLCERSLAYFPPRAFADLCRAMLEKGQGTPVGWRTYGLPARMASLIQAFAERAQPMDAMLAQDLLRLLDALVDMGDRRSAALQISEVFKDVRISAPTEVTALQAGG